MIDSAKYADSKLICEEPLLQPNASVATGVIKQHREDLVAHNYRAMALMNIKRKQIDVILLVE